MTSPAAGQASLKVSRSANSPSAHSASAVPSPLPSSSPAPYSADELKPGSNASNRSSIQPSTLNPQPSTLSPSPSTAHRHPNAPFLKHTTSLSKKTPSPKPTNGPANMSPGNTQER